MNTPASASPLLNAPAIGQPWPGQGGIYLGLRQYPEGLCHLVAAAADLPERHAFGDYWVSVDAVSRVDGRANASVLLSSGKHPAASACAAFSADGHSDFYLPSIGELHHAWQFAPDSFSPEWFYVSSTQYSAYHAYDLDFEYGWLLNGGKNYERLVRPVRRILHSIQ